MWDAQFLSYCFSQNPGGGVPSLAREFDHSLRVVTGLGRPGRGATQVEKSARFNRITHFVTVAHGGVCSANAFVGMAWMSFHVLSRKKAWLQIVTRCWNRARRQTSFHLAPVKRKSCNFVLEQPPLLNDTIDSVLRHWEVGLAKGLLAPLVITIYILYYEQLYFDTLQYQSSLYRLLFLAAVFCIAIRYCG
jgi:hypothetical protein